MCLGKRFEPVEVLLGLRFPKRFGVCNGVLVKGLIRLHRSDTCVSRKITAWGKHACFVHHVGNLLGGHRFLE